MSLEAFGDENLYTNGPMKECPDCEGYGKTLSEAELAEMDRLCVCPEGSLNQADQARLDELTNRTNGIECGTCSGTGEVYDEYEPCEGDVL